MGKSPGKWIKSVLFRKKSPNSSFQKKRDIPKSSFEKATSTPHQAQVSNVVLQPCFISEPVLVTGGAGYENKDVKCGGTEITVVPNSEPSLSSPEEGGDAIVTLSNDEGDDFEKYRLEQAATKAQATFRGYQARRAYRTLKDILRLQAVIRGHLVRRQAAATLNCVLGIVKFQALVRGQMVRSSNLGRQTHAKQTLYKQDAGFFDSITVDTCGQTNKLWKNAFIRQLLSSTYGPKPLHLKYDPEEPNSAWNWLLRWTMSRIWGTLSERKAVIESKSEVELQRPASKLNGTRKQPVNADKISARSTTESRKVKGNSRGNEIDKGEYNQKKVSNSSSDIPHQAEVHSGIRRPSQRKSSNSPVPNMAETKPKYPLNKSTKVIQGRAPDIVTQEKCMMQPVGEDQVSYLCNHLISDSLDTQLMNEAQDSNEKLLAKANHKISKRRASLPAKHGDLETLQHGTMVPSYMAATKSAKAKVRDLASPRFAEEVEKNGPARRYSLPSYVNAKPTSSPRVQRLVQSSGKGGIRIDRSMSSSRDSNDKMVQPEWKR